MFPGAIVFALAVTSLVVPGGDLLIGELTETYGRVVYGVGLALAWVFHRSRVFVVLICLGLLDIGLANELDREELVLTFGTVLIALIGVLALTRDRGMTSRGGLVQLSTGAAFAAIAMVTFAEPARVKSFAAPPQQLFYAFLSRGLPGETIVIALAAFLGVAYGYYRWRGPVDMAFIWSVLLIMLAIHPDVVVGARSGLMLVGAGLVLTLSVVETSYILAYRDDLTGLPGRRALMQSLDGINGIYTIAMVDVDNFKDFNDKHGHDVGDQVLQMVASRLGRTPGGAKAYRYGGEEFTLLFPGRTREQALPHLESVRESIEKANFSIRSWRRPLHKPDAASGSEKSDKKLRTLSVTVSIGMADTAGDDDSPEVVLKRSDQALYRAKKKGRNQVSK